MSHFMYWSKICLSKMCPSKICPSKKCLSKKCPGAKISWSDASPVPTSHGDLV